jgi:hypothetical protein
MNKLDASLRTMGTSDEILMGFGKYDRDSSFEGIVNMIKNSLVTL